ncbi:DNA-binding protein [Streptomyces sp. NPDC047097]|uniref:DNA-binding protein n=1 Tax=Streptomyces sp. NPDC047097 TaxID=3155260 RepID=UPI003405DE0F
MQHLQRRLHYCFQAWGACRHAAVARALPGVLADAHRAAETGPAGAVVLSRAYQLTASLLFKYGAQTRTPAVLAADRALAAAEQSGDPVAIGSAARRVARGLMHQQRHTAATEYALTTVAALRPDLESGGTAGLSTLGMLHLVAAVGATGGGRSPQSVTTATEQLTAAGEIATRQGSHDIGLTFFGDANVALHEVDVLLRLDDAWSALESAESITPGAVAALSRERQARHLVTTARAKALTRRRDGAVRDLLTAEELAPEEVRRPSVVGLVASLMELVPSPGQQLTGLASRCGLPA